MTLSGGGFRAMLFHAGALLRLDELGLLSKVARVSGVSGGSIAAGVLGRAWSGLGQADAEGRFADVRGKVVDSLLAFSRRRIDVFDAIAGLLPFTSAAEEVAESYDKHLFQGATLQDLPDAPRFVFCASNLQTGVLWRFSKAYAGDYVVGRLDRPAIPLARAVAASSAFPPILSPLTLDLDPTAFDDWPSRQPQPRLPEIGSFRRRVLLTDGGVYDNHGLEPLVKRYMTVLVSDGGAPFARVPEVQTDWVRQLRRILDVTDNQVRALRRRDLIARFEAGRLARAAGQLDASSTAPHARFGAYWGIATDAARVAPPGALPCDPDLTAAMAQVSTRLSDLGLDVSKRMINWGYAICDRSLRASYAGFEPLNAAHAPVWPFPELPLG